MNIRVLFHPSLALDANRKKGNFEKDLDAMLFGGFGAPPPRRRQAPETKPTEQGKPAEQPKPVDPKPQPTINVPVVPANQTKPNQQPVNPPSDAAKKLPVNTTDVNKSTDSGKNANQGQGGNTAIIISGAKVTVNPNKSNSNLNNKK
jgi:outer membrane biosynthesis protein TonB